MKTLLDAHGFEISPVKGHHSLTLSDKGIATWYEPQSCSRCGGSGIWRGGFHHTGVCYGCNGDGHGCDYKVKAYTEEAYARYTKRVEANAKRKAEKYNLETAKLLEEFSDRLDELESIRAELRSELERGLDNRASEFINKVGATLLSYDSEGAVDASRESIARSWIVKSDKTIEALKQTVEKRKAEKKALENTPDWEDGRLDVEGEILSVKWKDSDFGGSYKMLVKLSDGRRCWGSVPSKLDEAEEGDSVRFKATFSKSNDDPKFAFFKRPSVSKS